MTGILNYVKHGQKCPRCLTGMLMLDLSCLSCGIDLRPVESWELRRERVTDYGNNLPALGELLRKKRKNDEPS